MNILWIPHTAWDIPQRAHQFTRGLVARGHTVHVTNWVADFSTPGDYLSLRYLCNFFYRSHWDGAIKVHGIPRISPAIFTPGLRRFNTLVFSKIVQTLISRYAIEAVVGTFVVPPPTAPRVIFDLFDDNSGYWMSYGRISAYAQEIFDTEQAYLHNADAVVAASSVLADKAVARGTHAPVHLIPNGVDLACFADTDGTDGKALREKLNVRGKLVGLLGNHDKPAELEQVIAVARSLKDITFLIAGRGKAMPLAQAMVEHEGLDNIRFLGYIPLEKAPTVISALDVGLCPYAKTPGAEASSPMRLLMYLAAGVPSVCTDLESVRRCGFPNVVLIDDNKDALEKGILTALHLPKGRPLQINAFDLPRLIEQYERVLAGAVE
ncbi:MAG: glycosyltransferase [Chloroflexota bacterium]